MAKGNNKFRGKGKSDRQTDPLQAAKTHFGEHYRHLLQIDRQETGLQELLDRIKSFVENNYKGVTASQLRNIFSRLKTARNAAAVQRLRPNIMYIIARQDGKPEAQRLMYVVEDLMRQTETDDQVRGLQKFMESIVAYHKFFEVTKNKRY